jgi:protein gp37
MPTTIEWTQRPGTKGETWNPTTGCNKVSQGCKNCYAETMHRRLTGMGVKGYEQPFLAGATPQPHTLHRPLKWKTPRTVFVNSMSDLFHESVPFEFINQVFAVMALCPQHTFLILTKRPERMAEYFQHSGPQRPECYAATSDGTTSKEDHFHVSFLVMQEAAMLGWPGGIFSWPIPNVWLGTSVEDQRAADTRIPHLLRCQAVVRFLSCEPLLGPVDLLDIDTGITWGGKKETSKLNAFSGCTSSAYEERPYPYQKPTCRFIDMVGDGGINWVIAGGESGYKARPMHPDWARSLRDQCAHAQVPFFFKQWGEWAPGSHIDFKRNMVLLANGESIPYANPHWRTSATKYTEAEWNAHKPTAMHCTSKSRSGNLLDGASHIAYPTSSNATPSSVSTLTTDN